jgi:hypothetical protein
MTHPRLLVGTLAASALLAAGCGSSGSTPTKNASPAAAKPATGSAKPAPSKAVYVREADGVCRKAMRISRRANAAVSKAYAQHAVGRAADVIDQYTPQYAAQITELESLARPARDAQVLKGLLKVMDAQVTALTATSKALRTHNTGALNQIGAMQRQALQYAEALGKRYGFKVCGRASA